MGLKWDLGEDRSVIQGLKSNTTSLHEFATDLSRGVDAVCDAVDQGTLSGASYQAAKSLFVAMLRPISQAMTTVSEGIDEQISQYTSARGGMDGTSHIDEDQIKKAIQKIQSSMNLLETLISKVPGISGQIDGKVEQQHKLQKEIEHLHTFNSKTNGLFDDAAQMMAEIVKGIKYINQGTVNSNGTFTPGEGTSDAWLGNLKESNVKAILGKITRPDGITPSQMKDYEKALYKEAEKLLDTGWSNDSIRAFGKYVGKHIGDESNKNQKKSVSKLVGDFYDKSNKIGSQVFQAMWGADKLKDNDEQVVHAQNKLSLLLKIANMPGELNGTKKQTSELLTHFGKVSPDSKFWNSVAKTVQQAFPNGLANASNQKLAKMTNQFRYVISAQQAQYIRDKYSDDGKFSDREALILYLQDGHGYSTKESARLHQKRDQYGLDPDGKRDGYNIKIVEDFHTEFILDKNGNFLNEIDANVDAAKNKNGVINGASFNYAGENDYKSQKSKAWNLEHSNHYKYDMYVNETIEPQYRTDYIQNSSGPKGGKYEAPKKSKNKNEYSQDNNKRYSHSAKSSKDNVDKLLNKFKKEVGD